MLTGKQFGRYEIRQKIGAGGMGEVYLAHDDQLDRNVALKVLLPEFCSDPERTERFRLEAKAASALNHPNIITIFEVGVEDDRLFIATELVSGDTLREKIVLGELTLNEAIRYAEQIADALAFAHDEHIVHRDIKPDNIMIRKDGIVKILDFGLAKPLQEKLTGNEDETMRLIHTQPGIVMGSVRYMSPEQARGKETDARTDVWSVGVVLYEMVSGVNPFDGETVSDSLAAVIHVEPPAPDGIPGELQRIIRKALRKKPDERYQSIKDLALDLKDLRGGDRHVSGENQPLFSKTLGVKGHQTDQTQSFLHRTISADHDTRELKAAESDLGYLRKKGRKRRWMLPGGIILGAVALAFGALYQLPDLLSSQAGNFQTIQVSRLSDNGTAHAAEVSPDGKFAAFVSRQDGKQSIVVRQIGTGSDVTIVPPSLTDYFQPTFTADGEFVFYVSREKGVGTLFRVPTLGGESKKIIVDVDSKVSLAPDGKRLAFVRHNPNEGGDTIVIADIDGENAAAFVQTKEIGYDQLTGVEWSPDGEKMLVGAFKAKGEQNPKLRLATIALADQKLEFVGADGWLGVRNFEWVKDGEAIVIVGKANAGDNSQVWLVSYPHGEKRQITSDTTDYGSASVSADGRVLVATRFDVISSLWSRSPQSGEMRQLIAENRNLFGNAGISQMPDGRILFVKNSGREINIFSMEENGGGEKQLTSGNGINLTPVPTPDGKQILFSSNRSGTFAIWRMNADGSGAVQLTKEPNTIETQLQVTRDGRGVLFMRAASDGGNPRLMRVSSEGGDASLVNPEGTKPEFFPRLSRDGKLLAYHTFDFDAGAASVDSSVRVVGFDGEKVDSKVKEVMVPINPEFNFSPDGKSLIYINRAGVDNVWSYSLSDRKEKPLTDFSSGNISNFIWSNDGKRLFVVRAILNSDLVLIKDGNKV